MDHTKFGVFLLFLLCTGAVELTETERLDCGAVAYNAPRFSIHFRYSTLYMDGELVSTNVENVVESILPKTLTGSEIHTRETIVQQSNLATANVGNFVNIGNAIIAQDAEVGSYVQIQDGSIISSGAVISKFADIGPNVRVGVLAKVGEFTVLQQNVTLERGVNIANYNIIGRNSQLLEHASLDNFVSIGAGGIVGMNSVLLEHVNLRSDVHVGNNVIIDKHSRISDQTSIGDLTYIGQFTNIANNQSIGANAVVHEFVEIADGMPILDKQIVLAAPNTQMLIRIMNENQDQCEESNEWMEVNQSNNTEFNTSIMDMITQQWTELIRSCQSVSKMPGLSCIVRRYLVGYYGAERLNYLQNALRFGTVDMMSHNDLYGTYHLDATTDQSILMPETLTQMVRVLAAQKDIQRGMRTNGDELCMMLSDIRDFNRDVLVRTPRYSNYNSHNTIYAINYNNKNINVAERS